MILSLLLILIYLSFYILQIYRKKEQIDSMKSQMIGMVLGAANSVLIGLLMGISLQGKLAEATIYAILLSSIVGLLIGKPFGGAVIIEALCSGLMGGMMGAMLGEMLPVNDIKLMLLFMNTIYITIMSFMMIWIDSFSFSKKNNSSVIFFMVIPIMLVTSITYFDKNTTKQTITQGQKQHHEMQMP